MSRDGAAMRVTPFETSRVKTIVGLVLASAAPVCRLGNLGRERHDIGLGLRDWRRHVDGIGNRIDRYAAASRSSREPVEGPGTLLYVWRRNLWSNMLAHWLTDAAAFIVPHG